MARRRLTLLYLTLQAPVLGKKQTLMSHGSIQGKLRRQLGPGSPVWWEGGGWRRVEREKKKIQTWYDHRLGHFLHSGSYSAFGPADTGVTLTSRYTGLVSVSRVRVQPKTNTHTPR